MKYLITNQETQRLKFWLLESNDFNVWMDLFKEENVDEFSEMDTKGTAVE
ncbi:hypothetical protein [Aquimarina celericrescens]|uniref:Uncharacterized protein n=1 Tax=Aquimarina celericrescens TaxID=1964542 RepID=A0ABW5AVF0_9FLAO|nr:hypothetical protein [Aquimarina celericrescens]